MPEKSSGFWGSIPGILTGIAAVITATTGLYLAMKSENATDQGAAAISRERLPG